MAMEETDIVIMGEKEFFDVMKYANRHLTMEERYLIAGIVKEIIKPREDVKKKDTFDDCMDKYQEYIEDYKKQMGIKEE